MSDDERREHIASAACWCNPVVDGKTEPYQSTCPLPVVDAQCTMTHIGSGRSCSGDGYYRMEGSCANCKSHVVGVFTKGHEARSGWNSPKCPACACTGDLHWKQLWQPSEDPQ